MRQNQLRVWIEGTIFAALAIVLSLLPTNIGTGFTISLGMIPLTLYTLRRGTAAGFFSGFLWGVLHFLVGNAAILTVLQGLVEYFIAFAFVGAAGVFTRRFQTALQENTAGQQHFFIIGATFVGTFARFFWHFIAGYFYWGSYAPEGMSPFLYSLVMNGGSALVTAIATSIVLLLLLKASPGLFQSSPGMLGKKE